MSLLKLINHQNKKVKKRNNERSDISDILIDMRVRESMFEGEEDE